MAIDFQQDYQSLQLEKDANWSEAQANYRSLVNRWHPDRYARRPRELPHAQKEFIQLTKSFNNLRNFYRQNKRMPFELRPVATAQQSVPKKQQRIESLSDGDAELEILKKGKSSGASKTREKRLSVLWVGLTAFMVISSLVVIAYLDRRDRALTLEQAREVLKDTQPSEFLPKSDDIKRRSNRGAIMQNSSQGKIGDQLMQDVFR